MRQIRSRSALLIGLLLTASSIVGCGGSDDSGGGGAGLEKTKITVASLPLVNSAPLYIAQKEKLFEKEGLQVKIQQVTQSTQAIPSMKNGSVDLVYGNDATFMVGDAKGALKVKLIVEGATLTPKYMGVLVMPNSKIKTIQDLKGKTITTNVPNNIQVMTFNSILRANNVDPASIKWTPVVFPQMAAALEKGQVDAVHIPEPFLSDAQKKLGARMVVDGGAEPVTDLPLDGYFATKEWGDKNPKTALAFQRAMLKAAALATDRKQVEAVLPTYTKIDTGTAQIMTLPGFPTSVNATRLQRLADLLLDQKQIPAKLDAKTLLVTGTQ